MKKLPLFLLCIMSASVGFAKPTVDVTAANHQSGAVHVEATATSKAPAGESASTGTDSDSHSDSDIDSTDSTDDSVVSIGHNATLAADAHATNVVSVLGSSTSAGNVAEAVVSVLGSTRVTGPVGQSAVAVFGDAYVDSHVSEQVVAVFGNVELGPHADIGGDTISVGGVVKRDPSAITHGNVIESASFLGTVGSLTGVHSWIHHCLMYGRPLALAPGLGWAWVLALSFLGLYLLIALLFPKSIEQCLRTIDAQPGRTALAALLTFVCKPFVFLLIIVTVVGIILIPFLAFGLFVAGLFGKAVVFAWLGRRVLPARNDQQQTPPVLAVLVGGMIALLLYMVPILGFLTYKGLDILGLGIVVYTLIQSFQASRAPAAPAPAPAAAPPAPNAETLATAPEPLAAATPPPTGASARTPDAVPVSNATDAQRAGFWIRMAALTIDLIVVGIVCSMLNFSNHDLSGHGFLIVVAVYGACLWKLKGATIGGTICNLRVIRLDGRAIDWSTAVSRALGCFLSLAIAGLGFIWVVFDPERQSWHDKIAGTVVVRVSRPKPLV